MSEDETGKSSPSNSGPGKACYISPPRRTRPTSPDAPIPDERPPSSRHVGKSSEEGEDGGGYGQPPKRTQFRKGQSGNPKGRPAGAKGQKTLVKEILGKKIDVRTPDGKRRLNSFEISLMKLREKAAKGDLRAIREVLNYLASTFPETDETSAGHAATLTPAEEQILDYLLGGEVAEWADKAVDAGGPSDER